MNTLASVPFTTLLVGLMALVAKQEWTERRAQSGQPHFARPLIAPALVGAWLFVGTALACLPLSERYRLCSYLYRWVSIPSIMDVDDFYAPSRLIWYLLAYSLLFPLLLRVRRHATPVGGDKAVRRPTMTALLALFACALWVPWRGLSELPFDVIEALGYRCITSYTGASWHYRVSADFTRLREIALGGLDMIAAVTLLLWLFLFVWEKFASHGGSGGIDPNEANRPMKRRCIT